MCHCGMQPHTSAHMRSRLWYVPESAMTEGSFSPWAWRSLSSDMSMSNSSWRCSSPRTMLSTQKKLLMRCPRVTGDTWCTVLLGAQRLVLHPVSDGAVYMVAVVVGAVAIVIEQRVEDAPWQGR